MIEHRNDRATYCARCSRWYGEDPALIQARRFPRGSQGELSALTSYSGEPCECPEGPEPDEDD